MNKCHEQSMNAFLTFKQKRAQDKLKNESQMIELSRYIYTLNLICPSLRFN